MSRSSTQSPYYTPEERQQHAIKLLERIQHARTQMASDSQSSSSISSISASREVVSRAKARLSEIYHQCLAANLIIKQLDRLIEHPKTMEQHSYLAKYARRDFLSYVRTKTNQSNTSDEDWKQTEYERFSIERFTRYKEALAILKKKWTDILAGVNTLMTEKRYEQIVRLDPIIPDFMQVEETYLMQPLYERYRAEGGEEDGAY